MDRKITKFEKKMNGYKFAMEKFPFLYSLLSLFSCLNFERYDEFNVITAEDVQFL